MFVHDNGRVSVLCMTRCGSTSMREYFQIPTISTEPLGPWHWNQSTSVKVVVLRNPIQRMYSGYKLNQLLQKDEEHFSFHASPYMHMLWSSWDFKIIDFNNLSNYIPVSGSTYPTYTKITGGEYIENTFFSEKELLDEYSRYEHFMKTKEQITPEEWKDLTQ